MYRSRKTIEASSYIISRLEGELPYIKLIKLLYLADRELVKRRGRTISGATHYSLPYGPILSETLQAIKYGDPEWDEYFETDKDARLIFQIKQAPPSALSRADREVLDFVLDRFGHMKWKELVNYTHGFAEWHEVKKGRRIIHLYDIAIATGHSFEEAAKIVEADGERDDVEHFVEGINSRQYA